MCLVKYVPNVDKFQFNYETNTVVRSGVRLILNPEDEQALAAALALKDQTQARVEVVTMGPLSVKPMLEDLVRMGVDQVSLLSDASFAGSDSYVTSHILGRYLKGMEVDLVLTGTHALDGDTSHVPSQVAEYLGWPQMSNAFDLEKRRAGVLSFSAEAENKTLVYEMDLPGVVSLGKEASGQLPFIKYEDMVKDVSGSLKLVSNDDMHFQAKDIGLEGSLTKVKHTYSKNYQQGNQKLVGLDQEGIDYVYTFLLDHGYLKAGGLS